MKESDKGGFAGNCFMGRRFFVFLVLLAAGAVLLSGCTQFAKLAGKSSYQPPETASQRIAAGNQGPLVLLVTGSMIVSDFYDVMAKRLEERGFRPVVYQPPDLFTESLVTGAGRISEAVDAVLASTGEDRLIILAECDGGIASRYYVEKLGGDQKVSRLITFVSAHNGTEWMEKATFPQAIVDIHPDSEFMKEARTRRPPADGPLMISLYVCTDEIMIPYTTSMVPGALNIEVCDDGFDKRAREREPVNVNDFFGNRAVEMYPIHLNVFWDEPFFELIVACLTETPDELRQFKGLNLEFDMETASN